MLKELFDSGKMPDKGVEILWGVAEGVTQWEIAEETGLTDDQVDTRLRRMRRKFRLRLEALGMIEKKDAGEATEKRPVGYLPDEGASEARGRAGLPSGSGILSTERGVFVAG